MVVPQFESVGIVGDNAKLVAEIASLFTRPKRYLPVLDGPRMTRPDWTNEVIVRANALTFAKCHHAIFADLSVEAVTKLGSNRRRDSWTAVKSVEEAVVALKGIVKAPTDTALWGRDNLAIGLLTAKRSKKILRIVENSAPTTNFLAGGKHFLIACEAGDDLASIAACNLAFATNASLLMLPQMPREDHAAWLEDIYSIESKGDVTGEFSAIQNRVRAWLPKFEFNDYKQILFVTRDFPWGIAFPQRPTTHMFNYPDFGRSVVESIWASQDTSRSARNALLLNPHQVGAGEIEKIRKALVKNKTLVRVQAGPRATVNIVDTLMAVLPTDIIVISTHAGDAKGERITYEYKDSERIPRRLVVDSAVGFSYNPKIDKVQVQEFERFHELDGVDWTDSAAKAKMYVGTAIRSWVELGNVAERNKYKTASISIPRVIGSMGLQMHDHIWFAMVQGFAPSCAPVVLNNACSSWHELGQRFLYAGARAYIGALFPVTNAEAEDLGAALFEKQLSMPLPLALWSSQNNVYGRSARRPYAMLGLPFCSIQPNRVDSIKYLTRAYRDGLVQYEEKAKNSPYPDVKENSQRFAEFLREDWKAFTRAMQS